MKKSFYDILWQVCRTERQLEKWINQGLLVQTNDKFFWHPNVLEVIGEPNTKIVGELKVDSGHPSLILPKNKKKVVEDIPWITEYNNKFSKEKIGLPGRRSDLVSTLEKMNRFLQTYDYTKDEILGATENYITECLRDPKKTEFIRKSGYFIFKLERGTEISDLAQWCEDYRDQGSNPQYTSRTSI